MFNSIRPKGPLTSNVIHEMGSSWGISVLLTRSRVSFSSSKAKVKMAPGGVQVPTMRWCMGMVMTCGPRIWVVVMFASRRNSGDGDARLLVRTIDLVCFSDWVSQEGKKSEFSNKSYVRHEREV